MNTQKSLIAIVLSAALALGFTGCGSAESSAASAQSHNSGASGTADITVGICQMAQHPSLDAATQGFMDVIEEAMPGKVQFDVQNASNDIPTCGVICNGFAASGVDLILANATPSLQAAAAATTDIPILGTAVTEYGVALDLEDFDGVVGGNISGTCDLAPLDQQAAMIPELLPEAKKVGILYCSGEPNSLYQADVVEKELQALGLEVSRYTFADSNDVAAVTGTACDENDVIYIPTDNTAASCAAAINNVAEPAGVPIITGDSGTCSGCGLATFALDYYELGRITGEMAVKILNGEADIAQMPVEYYDHPVKMINQSLADSLQIAVPQGYTPLNP